MSAPSLGLAEAEGDAGMMNAYSIVTAGAGRVFARASYKQNSEKPLQSKKTLG